jgi:hypothetical protein
MWGYYGSKSKIIGKYPKPSEDKIIEPFAGTAQYALRYFDRDIEIYDKYEVLVNLWKWLQQCSPGDILSLPELKLGDNVDDFTWDCEEAKHLVGFIITGGATQPKKSPSKWKTKIRPNTQNYKKNYISSNLFKIRHWKIECKSYEDIPNKKATWFIDPPYEEGGIYYRHSSKNIDFSHLSEWCQEREGEVIVCEKEGASWLPFKPLTSVRGLKSKDFPEALWLKNMSIDTQTKLFTVDS